MKWMVSNLWAKRYGFPGHMGTVVAAAAAVAAGAARVVAAAVAAVIGARWVVASAPTERPLPSRLRI